MSWQRVTLYGLAAIVAFDCAAVVAWLVAVDIKTRSSRRNADKPIRNDDTMRVFERVSWGPGYQRTQDPEGGR